jgi:hypothetical protein
MTTEEIKNKINEYFDGELKNGDDVLLFTQLSLNEEAREYFKEVNFIKTAVQESMEDIPLELEERIMYSLENASGKSRGSFSFRRTFSYLSAAAAIVLLILSLFFYIKNNEYSLKLESTIEQVKNQNQMIELLYNSLPAAEVQTKLVNPVIVKSKL